MDSVKQMRREVKKYIDSADEKVVKMMHAMLEAEQESDWWDHLELDAKASIEQGLKEAQSGKTTPHEIVMKKYKKWL